MAFLPAIGAVLGAVGTGISFVSQMSAAKTQAQFSALNAQAGIQSATQQASVASLQSQIQANQAATAQKAAYENADALRAQAEQDAAIGQQNIRRNRDEFQRQLAQATAAQGGSGAVIAAGSPLDLLVNAADTEAQDEAWSGYGVNTARNAAYREAAGVQLGGRVQGMNSSLYQLESLSAIQEGRAAASQARITGLQGQAAAAGMRSQAFGGLLGGIGNLGGQVAKTSWFKKKWS